MRRVAIAAVVFGLAGHPAGAEVTRSAPPPPRPVVVAGAEDALAFAEWKRGFLGRAREAGISPQVLERAAPYLVLTPEVLALDRQQAEFTRQIWDYLDSAVSEARIRTGRHEAQKRAALLDRIEAAYGVEREVLLAIWGMETNFGGFRGTTSVLGALATLAHDPRRGAYFERELIAALRILQAGDTTAGRMKGSWAGAMGHTQFMPSSYLERAVDFDGDGRRNIWGADPTDALASTAAYLRAFDWQTGAPWGIEVRLPEGFDYALTGRRDRRAVAEWQGLGVRAADGGALPDHGPAAILAPAGARGPAFAIFANFEVIARYNNAVAYVLGVGHLSDRIGGAGAFRAGWPRHEKPLRIAEVAELQRHLVARGHDTGGVDGRIGPATTAAIRAFQRSQGLTPDGFVTRDVLNRLR